MIDVEGANKYFRTRTVFEQWNEFSTEQQSGAIEQAKRDLSRELGRVMNENEQPYQMGQKRRDEYAVYEQAFYSLMIYSFPTGNDSTVVSPLPNDEENYQFENGAGRHLEGYGKWSKEALLWLADRVTVETITS